MSAFTVLAVALVYGLLALVLLAIHRATPSRRPVRLDGELRHKYEGGIR